MSRRYKSPIEELRIYGYDTVENSCIDGFKYDPFGRRIEKSSSSSTSIYAYDGDNLIEETNASGTVVARYSHGPSIDDPLAMLRSSATSYYEQDGLGSVTSLSNGAGTLAQTYMFDSFGKLTASSGSLTNPFQYAGREFDPETSLYFYRARYYDPNVGRFIGEDLLRFASETVNFYGYTYNSPLNWVDPFGLQQQLGVGIEPPLIGGSAVHNGVLDPSDDPGHTLLYLRDPSGQITDVLSFGPARNINPFNVKDFMHGNLPATGSWPIKDPVVTYQFPLSKQQYANCKKVFDEFKKQPPGQFSPQRTCTTVSIALAKKCGVELPNGVSPVNVPGLGGGNYPNPFGLNRQLNRTQAPVVVPASQFPR